MKGHIRQRSKGSWTIIIDVGKDPQTGKRKQQWHTVEGTKRDAERELREMLHSMELGTYVKPAKTTVGEFLNQWLEDYVVTNTAPRTAEFYDFIVHQYLIPNLGTIPLIQLQPSHVQSYYAKAATHGRSDGKGGLSGRTVLHIHRVLSEALNHGVRWQIVARNVALAATPPHPRRQEMKTFTQEQVRQFLSLVAGSSYHDLFYMAIWTGMRRGELLGLRWQDVDLDLAQLSVNQTIQRVSGKGFVVEAPKTARSRRTIALTPSLCILLRQHKERQIQERLLLGLTLQAGGLVFARPDGKPLDPDAVSHTFKKIIRKAGMPDIRLHDLRHTHASLMLKQGAHPKVVSERLGHSSIAITLDTYSHVMPGLQEAAAKRFEEDMLDVPVTPSMER